MKFLLWILLAILCWPLALVVAIVFPIVWLLALPFRVVAVAVEAMLALLRALLFLPSKVLNRL